MKINFIFLFHLLISFSSFSQKSDHIWLIGDDNNLVDTTHGGTTIDFNFVPAKASYHYRKLNMFVCNVSISDSSGNLLFYSNGCEIAGHDDQVLLNGDSINPGTVHEIGCVQNNRGYPSNHQSAVILPVPDTHDLFYLFHKSESIVFNPTVVSTDQLLYSVVKTKNTIEAGEVLVKNMPVMQDLLAFGEMNAVKHGNGKDWWVITPKESSNQFYIFLFTKDGIIDTLVQTIGNIPPAEKEGYGQTVFSPDGSRMIRYYPYTDIMNFSFDRNTGFFTDFSIFKLDVGSSIAFDGGCAFSPSGRYLYIAALTNIYQFDMTANDIAATQTTVATWDGFVDPIAITFWHSQLGPDCKIYINGGGDTRYYHIIHNPDEPGLACNVEQRGLKLPTPSGASIPYFPNYRLGPIDNPGLPCSPVVATNQPVLPVPGISAWPNPASSQVSFGPLPPGARSLRLYDVYGRVAKEVALSSGSEVYTLSVADLAAGLYFWEVAGAQGARAGRLVLGR